MTDLYTTAEVARRLGVSRRWTQDIATKHNIGTMLHARQRVFTAEDVERLRSLVGRPPGRPRAEDGIRGKALG